MPDTMAGNISKGRILRLLDAHLTTGTDITTVFDNLLNGEPLSNVIQDMGPNGTLDRLHAIEKRHINKHWLGITTPTKLTYWPQLNQGTKDSVLREGFLDALERSSAVNGGARVLTRSIVTYWLCAGSHFEVIVCADAPDQTTIILATPSIAWRYLGRRRVPAGSNVDNADNPDGPLTHNDDIYVYGPGPEIRYVAHEANKRRMKVRGDATLVTRRKRRFGTDDMTGNTRSYIVKGEEDAFDPDFVAPWPPP